MRWIKIWPLACLACANSAPACVPLASVEGGPSLAAMPIFCLPAQGRCERRGLEGRKWKWKWKRKEGSRLSWRLIDWAALLRLGSVGVARQFGRVGRINR